MGLIIMKYSQLCMARNGWCTMEQYACHLVQADGICPLYFFEADRQPEDKDHFLIKYRTREELRVMLGIKEVDKNASGIEDKVQ